MADTGNRACSLISEETFKRIYSTQELKNVPSNQRQLRGAGKEHALTALGVPKHPLHMWFYSPNKDELRQVMFVVRPVVVKNLNLPFLLAYNDLKTINAKVDTKTDTLELHSATGSIPLLIPMRGKPISNVNVTTSVGITIEPGQEVIIPAQVQDGLKNAEVFIEPNENFASKTQLMMVSVVDKVRDENRVMMRLWNPHSHEVKIKANSILGHANILSEEPCTPEVAQASSHTCWDACAHIAHNVAETLVDSLKMSNGQNNDLSNPKNMKELFQRLWKDFQFDSDITILSKDQKVKLIKRVMKRRKALALAPEDVGLVKGIEFSIDTQGHSPIQDKSRPLPPNLIKDLKEQIHRWMKQGVAEPGSGPWAAALVPVIKKNGNWRFAVDYRRLNAITKKDARPVANLNDRLALLKGQVERPLKYWASMDLSEAYHCVPIKEEDKDKTAVITPLGLYRFNRMTFGFCNAPQTFHEVVQLLEKGMMEKDPMVAQTILLYFDDAILGGHTFEELLEKIDLFLQCVEELGLKIQPKKCIIGAKELKWIGHTISADGIRPDPDMVRTIKDWDPPHDSVTLGALTGALNYFRKFNRNHSAKIIKISELVKKTGKYKKDKPVPLAEPWSHEHQKELDDVLEHLMKPPVLMHPDFGPEAGPFIISVDTSSHGVGMSLSQEQEVMNPITDKKEWREVFIAFGSKKLNPAQSKWSSYRMEMYGLVLAVQNFRYFLLGRKFKIRTDNKALANLMKSTNQNLPAQCFRWQQTLSDYDFEITHVPGKKMKLVDSLSRKTYKNGDEGTLNDFIPFRDIRWDDELETIEEARIREDDEFWIPFFKKKHEPPKNIPEVAVLTRSQANMQPEMHEDEHFQDGGDTPPTQISPPIAEYLTQDDTWNTLAEGLPEILEETEVNIEIPEEPEAWWLKDILKAQLRMDKSTNTIMEYINSEKEWPTNASEIKRRVGEIFGQNMIGIATNPEEEAIAKDQIRLAKMFNASKNGQDYAIKNEVLWIKRISDGIQRSVMVIPKGLITTMIQTIHHGEGTFHLGIDRTLTVAEQFYWTPGLKDEITYYINTCKTCQDGKRLPSKSGPGLGQTASRPHQRLKKFAMDCVQMPKGKYGYTYLLTMLDISTTWIEAWPMKHANALTICKILEHDVFPRFGEGLTLLSDQGREFIAKTLKTVVKKYHGRLYYGTAHHPNSNPIERHHRTLVSLIRCLLIDAKSPKEDWPETLSKALYTMRCAPNAQTKQSAFQRVYGFYPFTQAASWLGRDPNQGLEYQDLDRANERNQEFTEGPYPDDEANEEPEIVHEDEETIVIRSGEQRRELKKIPGENQTFLAEVNAVTDENVIQEYAQAKRDKAAITRHSANKRRFDRKVQPRKYQPCLWEIVDWKSFLDPESTNSRKLANVWRGPYVVTKIRKHPYNVDIMELDLKTMKVDKTTKRDVYTGDLRPTLNVAFENRPHQGWSPNWLRQ